MSSNATQVLHVTVQHLRATWGPGRGPRNKAQGFQIIKGLYRNT